MEDEDIERVGAPVNERMAAFYGLSPNHARNLGATDLQEMRKPTTVLPDNPFSEPVQTR